MADAKNVKKSGFLSTVLKDETGNAIAIMAAAMFPVIGMVGGAVDMSRIYLARTKLQAACDAGSLMGRKDMGNGKWDDDSYRSRGKAEQIFTANFKDGEYGTENLQKEFTETGGNVKGKVSVDVPMTLMKVFGQDKSSITTYCNAELRIPNSDVMFVLDVTGSMASRDWFQNPDTGVWERSEISRIDGLKTATKCFYEALVKKNIEDVSPEDCDETSDPTTVNEEDAKLRFGFVPYSSNVNVGKLLPLDYIANEWTYQSREAIFGDDLTTDPVANLGEESDFDVFVTQTNSGNSGYWHPQNVSITRDDGSTATYIGFVETRRSCRAFSSPPTQSFDDDIVYELLGQTPDPLVQPATEVTKVYRRTTGTFTLRYYYAYYRWYYTNGAYRSGCMLRASRNGDITTEYMTTTTPVTWEYMQSFNHWYYKPTTFDVSGLKDDLNGSWNDSVSLPLGTEGANKSISWSGCVEERQTFKVDTEAEAKEAIDPIPSNALDMDIDSAPDPSNPATLWGPSLDKAIYFKFDNNGSTLDNFTSDQLNGPEGYDTYDHFWDMSCPIEAKTYQEWEPEDFTGYVNSLYTTGFTHHDAGLTWGARLMSPTGIFSDITGSEEGEVLERHMIFMTDGRSQTNNQEYGPYGISYYDRRQTNFAPTSSTTNSAIIRNRSAAICTAIRNKNIKLWVIAYGRSVVDGTSTENRLTREFLQNCATPGLYFEAANTSALLEEFKGIASQISNLRLTE